MGGNLRLTTKKEIKKKRIMIKNLHFSLLMLASVLSFAQGYDLPVTFDNGSVTYGVVDFGGNSSSVVVDPSDASNMVVKSEKTAAAATWAGTTIGIDQSGTVTSLVLSCHSRLQVLKCRSEFGHLMQVFQFYLKLKMQVMLKNRLKLLLQPQKQMSGKR